MDKTAGICTAIRERRLLAFDYNGSRRLAFPCAHGVLTTGNEALRAHDIVIVNGTQRTSMGKLYLLAAMSDVQPTNDHFERPPYGYRRGDRGMATIHCQL